MFDIVQVILTELLDVHAAEITPNSYLVRDLGMESIDFLELAVALNQQFQVPVHDDTLFLRDLRVHLIQAREAGLAPVDGLRKHYAFLSRERLAAIAADLEAGPVIQVQDLIHYIQWQMKHMQVA